jgi:hypothetical protein
MEEIKSVRLSYDFKKNNYYKDKDGRSLIKTSDSSLNNYKLTLFKGKKEKDRRVILYRVGQNNQLTIENKFYPVTFDYNKRYKDWLNDPDRYIEAWLSIPNNKDFSINQDPWQESVPNRINFGSEIYFLNNASQVLILWQSAEKSGFEEGGVDLIYPYNLFGKEIEESNNQSNFGDYFSDDDGNELDIPRWAPEKQTYTQPISGTSEEIDYGSKNFDLETGLPIISTFTDGYAAKPSQIKAHVITKHLVIWPPGDETEEGSIILLDDKNFSKIGEVNENTNIAVGSMTYPGNVKDIDILRDIVDSWNRKVPNYGLDICSKKTEFCKTLTYISPIDNLNQVVEPEETNSIENDDKLDLKVLIPENLQLKVKEDIQSLKIYIGDIPKLDSTDFEFGDLEEDFSLLGDEFTESEFTGFEETSQFESQGYDNEADRIQSEQQSEQLASEPYIPSGKHKLDMIPGVYKGNPVNGKPIEIQLCQIHGKPVNVKVADPLLDMIEAASKDGVIIKVTSGFRPAFYPNLNAKSSNGVTVTAQSQEDLYKQNCKGGKCQPDTAKAGTSKHGSGIAVDFNTGSRGKSFKPLNTKVYTWLVKNSWRFGFVRTVKSEEWHYEFYPDKAKKGPYAILAKSNELFYADLGLNNLQIS